MKREKSLVVRAANAQSRDVPVVVNPVIDVSKGRPFNPLTPKRDGYPRIMITAVPMWNSETGEQVTAYHVDYFNCENAHHAARIYAGGQATVKDMVEKNERPEPL